MSFFKNLGRFLEIYNVFRSAVFRKSFRKLPGGFPATYKPRKLYDRALAEGKRANEVMQEISRLQSNIAKFFADPYFRSFSSAGKGDCFQGSEAYLCKSKDSDKCKTKESDNCKTIEDKCGEKRKKKKEDDICSCPPKEAKKECKKEKADPCACDPKGSFEKHADDPCKRKDKKDDPCKAKEEKKAKKHDPCKKIKNPCEGKPKEKKKDDPCKSKDKGDDPCACKPKEKKKDECKKDKGDDPCACKPPKASKSKKDDPCKSKKDDPCKPKKKQADDPCKKKAKKDDPCKSTKGSKKDDPCKPKKETKCKKEDPCKSTKASKSKKDDPCKSKKDKKDDPCASKPPKKCDEASYPVINEPCSNPEMSDPENSTAKFSEESKESLVAADFDIFNEIHILDPEKYEACKEYFGDNYQNSHTHSFHEYAFYNLNSYMSEIRQPQPSTKPVEEKGDKE